MRSHRFITLLLALLVLGLLAPMAVAQDTQTLTVSIWGFNLDVLEENVFAPFEEMHNVDIVLDTGNNSDRLARLQAEGANTDIDVAHFATQFTHIASQEGLLQPYNPDGLENLDEVYDWAQDPLGNQAGVGYTVNSLSLIYRSDLIEAEITSWADLLRDDVAGFVSIPEMSTTFGPAALIMIDRALAMREMDESEEAAGINYDADLAWEALPQLADNLVTTYIRSSELTTLVQEEEVWVAPYASFAIGNLINTGHDLSTVVPAEGVVGQTNMISITAATDQVDLAHAYIDWFISHDVQLAEALDLIDSPVNATVELPEDICALLTCGDMLDTMIVLDQAQVSDRLEDWLERWNEVMVR
ncbi:MAG: extracellular solute-binding protein [Chloroflexota bacterium]|nr:extracellular solute-binding protein [Chloroflexota bacterium]